MFKGIILSSAIMFSSMLFGNPDELKPIDPAAYGIELGEPPANLDSCVARFNVRADQFFNNEFEAVRFCQDVHRNTRVGNLCVVRQFGNNHYGASFFYNGFAQGNSFFGALGRIIQFLNDTGLLNQVFQFIFDLFGSSRSC